VRLARRHAEVARALADRHHAYDAAASALRVVAVLGLGAGDVEGALAAATAGVAAADRAGDPRLHALLLELLSDAQESCGRLAQARDTAARALTIARQASYRETEGTAELRLGSLWAAQDPPAAAGHLLRALAIATQLDDHGLEVQARVLLARLACDQADMAGARAELARAAEVARPLRDPGLSAEVWNGWARLAEAMGCQSRQVALLWTLAIVHAKEAGEAAAAKTWEEVERALAATGDPDVPALLAAHAAAALAHDGGHGLLEEVFGPFDVRTGGSV
jgi:tetratricopeptide (TPR) repeat protein